MPGLVKVGFSSKDPDLRASELNHTGSPHPYVVGYEVLTEHPRDIEKQVHRKLSECREGREWFRCTPEFAVSAVQQIVGGGAIVESFKRADRLKAEKIRRQHEEEKENQERAEARWQEQEQQIRTTYEQRLQEAFPEHPAWGYIVAGIVLSFFALSGLDLSFRMVRLPSGLLSLELWEGLSGKNGTVTTRKLPMATVRS